MNRDTVLEVLRNNKHEIEKLGAYKIALFGSYARKENTVKSDIDLMIEVQTEKKTFDNFMNICFFLEELFGKKVDLLTRESVSSDFYNMIKKEIIYV